jgi:hypothetical protein
MGILFYTQNSLVIPDQILPTFMFLIHKNGPASHPCHFTTLAPDLKTLIKTCFYKFIMFGDFTCCIHISVTGLCSKCPLRDLTHPAQNSALLKRSQPFWVWKPKFFCGKRIYLVDFSGISFVLFFLNHFWLIQNGAQIDGQYFLETFLMAKISFAML